MALAVPLVFVSSTRRDLDDYRNALIANFPRLNVLYRGMEFFGARPTRPREVMLSELRTCDLYVGILARRYGSIDAASGLSYTELEYQKAGEMGKERIMFLLDPKHTLPATNEENDEAGTKRLEDFKARITETVVLFSTPDSLVSAFTGAVARWLERDAAKWRHMTRAGMELDLRLKQAISRLYRSTPEEMIREIDVLQHDNCPLALEHFYGILLRPDVQDAVKEHLLARVLVTWPHPTRVIDVLGDLLDSGDVNLRPKAVLCAGDRARAEGVEPLPLTLIERVLAFADDPHPTIREEVAHALWKLPEKWPNLLARCREMLETLTKDDAPQVRRRAVYSLQTLAERWPNFAARATD